MFPSIIWPDQSTERAERPMALQRVVLLGVFRRRLSYMEGIAVLSRCYQLRSSIVGVKPMELGNRTSSKLISFRHNRKELEGLMA